jgi:pyroglutamyl-peptidase
LSDALRRLPHAPVRALVTAFDAFGGDAVNASLMALRRLPPRIGRLEIETLELPTSFARAPAALAAGIAATAPDLVLCTGEAGDRNALSIERVATNLCDARIADNDGAQPKSTRSIADGPAAYFATLPLNTMLAALREAGLPAEISGSAGSYVCNHVFYTLMHLAAGDGHRWRGGFLHVPHAFDAKARPQAAMRVDDIVRGIVIALDAAAAGGLSPASV